MKELLKFKTFTAPMEGVSQSTGNPWRKITAIFETLGDRPHDIAFSALSDPEKGAVLGEAARRLRRPKKCPFNSEQFE